MMLLRARAIAEAENPEALTETIYRGGFYTRT
jgi:hypothetical protein